LEPEFEFLKFGSFLNGTEESFNVGEGADSDYGEGEGEADVVNLLGGKELV